MMALFNNQGGSAGAGGSAMPGAGHPGASNSKMDVATEVRSMRSAGLTDDQILTELQQKGVKENAVISALGSLNHEVPSMENNMGGPAMPASPVMNDAPMGDMGAAPATDDFRLPAQPPSMPQMPGMGGHPTGGPSGSGHQGGAEDLYERIEEITEEMIDEKWNDLIKEVQKIIAWKNKSESRLVKLESAVGKLAEDFKTLHQGVLGKVEEYDQRMTEVGTELKAVGKVFKDVIPVFTENVKELRDVTQNMKK